MNWFTRRIVVSHSIEKKQKLIEEHGACEHATEDPSKLYVMSYENDSFGSEGHGLCQECWDAIMDAEDETIVACQDCKAKVPQKNTIAWKPYDFYAPQGDQPMIICTECAKKEKHQQRVEKDREEYEAEMRTYDRSSW